MKIRKWNDNWKFWSGGDSFALVWGIPENAVDVTLPHDAMALETPYEECPNGTNTGYVKGALYTYVKRFYVPSSAYAGKDVIVRFEGIYEKSSIYVNEQLVGSCNYGYSVVDVNITGALRLDAENEIRVIVRNGAMANSRWYSGGGIYKDVYMLIGEKAHIAPYGVRINTLTLDDDSAEILVKTRIDNKDNSRLTASLETRIIDPSGKEAASVKVPAHLMPLESREIVQRITVTDPSPWSEDTPDLYKCVSVITSDDFCATEKNANMIIDSGVETFGIRTMSLDKVHGLRVNGKTVKLRGACVHHDSGLIGAATYDSVMYRQVRKMKEAGFNALRIAHNPAAPALLRACDKLGVYVMDEFVDMWTRNKTDYDYSISFETDWKKDLKSMIMKDYNHPSVIMYSIGNEIPEIGTDIGTRIGTQMNAYVKELDDSRYTTAGINGVFAAGDKVGEIMQDILSAACDKKEQKSAKDVEGIEAEAEVEIEAETEAKRDVEIEKESGTQENTDSKADGKADNKADNNADGNADGNVDGNADGNVNDFMTVMDAHMDEIVNHKAVSQRLDNACTFLDIAGYNYMTARYEKDHVNNPDRIIVGSETYPPQIARNWAEIEKYSTVIGDFTWTGWDYIGEAGIGIPAYKFGEGGFGASYPCRLSYVGDFDITGFRRPVSYYRQIVFGLRKAPYIAVQDPHHYGEKVITTPWVMSDAISSWTWDIPRGSGVIVEVYSAGDEAELILNGKSLGRKASGKKEGYRTLFDITYEEGELEAVSYENGKEIGRVSLVTAGEASKIEVVREQNDYKESCNNAVGNGSINIKTIDKAMEKEASCDNSDSYENMEIVYLNISLCDDVGNVNTESDTDIHVSLSDNLELMGFGSADPRDVTNYKTSDTKTFNGRCQLIVHRRDNNKGIVTLKTDELVTEYEII